MNTQWIRHAAVAALAAASFQAHAATVTLTGWAFGAGSNVSTTAPRYTGPAGAFIGQLANTGPTTDSNSFVTYCIELEQFFSFSATPMVNYTLIDGGDYFRDRRGDATKAERLGRLLTFVSQTPGAVDTAMESASMQLAIWNIVYDTDWLVSTQSAFRDFSDRRGYADTLLAGALSVTNSSFSVYALQGVGTQDFLVATQRLVPSRNSSSNQVPEPASWALAAAALAGLGLARRRGVNRWGAAAA